MVRPRPATQGGGFTCCGRSVGRVRGRSRRAAAGSGKACPKTLKPKPVMHIAGVEKNLLVKLSDSRERLNVVRKLNRS